MKQVLSKSTSIHIILFLFFIFCYFYPQPVSAHSPENVQLEYDSYSQVLKVTITHNTSSPDSHYVKKVTIVKNGSVLSTNDYDSQPEKDTFTYSYGVSVEDGDTFEVTAYCSIFGDKTNTLVIRR